MKKYILKKYKGNLVESLEKFNRKYPGMRIVEVTENDGGLEIATESTAFQYDLNYAWETLLHANDQFLGLIDQIRRAMKDNDENFATAFNSVVEYRSRIGDANNPYYRKVREFFQKVLPSVFFDADKRDFGMAEEMTLHIIFNMASMCNT